jgi:hypothetical protein
MNWGKGIIVAMALFMGFIIFLVVNIMSKTVDLESEDYYKREINYQEEITQQNNTNALADKVKLLSQEEFVVVQIPEKGDFTEINVHFLRPDDKNSDKVFQIKGTKSYLIPKIELVKGKYNIEIRYQVDSKQCLQKETIII